MKTLIELLVDTSCATKGNTNIKIKGIACHSNQVKPGYLFVTLDGFETSGKKYINAAIKHGAIAIASDAIKLLETIYTQYRDQITIIKISNPRSFLALVANRYYDFPSQKINLIGITGTDGKTTTSYMIKSIIEASGAKTGLIGTIKYYDGKTYLPAPNTTPESIEFIRFLSILVKRHIPYCISEVSSHALSLNRVNGQLFSVGIFTNLTQDHLDFHKTMKNYRAAKLKLFTDLSPQSTAIVNKDDNFFQQIVKHTRARIISYSLKNKSDLSAQIIKRCKDWSLINVRYRRNRINIKLPIPGMHNVSNMLAAFAAAIALDIPLRCIKKGLEKLPKIDGRLQRIKTEKGFDIYIDYAHTEKALSNAINTLKQITTGRVIVVFGCGGNRDRLKRPQMGKCATMYGDYAFITTDNPRKENPINIINDIKKGLKKNNYEVIVDRKTAIRKAIMIARPGDSVLIAGKGHEEYQIIGNKKIYFSDYTVANSATMSK